MLRDNNNLQKTNILIVDDDATVCLLMKEALTEDIYSITLVHNGIDALSEIKEHRPDLVLLDVTMPGINGFQVCTEIRKLYGNTNISIVMVTALEDAASIAKSYDLGATDFISKPINWDTFPYRIQYLLKARNAIVEIQQHQLHLEYMENISRIITQNKDKEVIMKETMFAMLDIFSADRAILIKPDETLERCFIIDCDTGDKNIIGEKQLNASIIDTLKENLIYKANNSEYPVVTRYDSSDVPPTTDQTLKQQMISALHVKHTQDWYLIIQQHVSQTIWTAPDEETFYKVSLRLTNMLSRYLLTEELGQSEELLKQTQKISHLGNWNWNSTGRHLTWSDEIYQIYGHTKQTYTPDFNTYFEIDFEEDINRMQSLKDLQNNITHSYILDHRIRRPDNSIRWVHEQCIAIYDGAGVLMELNGIVQDITKSHLQKEQEVHNNKMEAIGQLTSGIAHDFGNLMTVAKGNIEILEETISKNNCTDHEIIELLEDTTSAINDSVELTRQLLSFSRKRSIAPTYVNIKQTFDKFKTLFKKTLGGNIRVTIDIDDDLPDIHVDPTQFESTLLNVIINARNAMPNNGELKISAQVVSTRLPHDIIRNIDNELGEKCICIFITDNGLGMSEETQARAIEPFFTTHTNKGTGLGLSMVYGFIKQSGGELIIQSQPDKGTTIHLQFPIHGGVATNKTKTEPIRSLQGIRSTILIVEDHPAVKQFAVRCLKQSGVTILQADNAATARELLISNHVDLLFTDIVMPGDMDGHQLAEWASQECHGLKILLTTAMEKHAPIEIETPGHDANTIDKKQTFKLLEKPYNKDDLIEHIVDILEHGIN